MEDSCGGGGGRQSWWCPAVYPVEGSTVSSVEGIAVSAVVRASPLPPSPSLSPSYSPRHAARLSVVGGVGLDFCDHTFCEDVAFTLLHIAHLVSPVEGTAVSPAPSPVEGITVSSGEGIAVSSVEGIPPPPSPSLSPSYSPRHAAGLDFCSHTFCEEVAFKLLHRAHLVSSVEGFFFPLPPLPLPKTCCEAVGGGTRPLLLVLLSHIL